MNNKKYLLISCIALLAILVSACAGAVSPTQAAESQPASDVSNQDAQPVSNVPFKGGPGLTAAASTLGISVEELQKALQDTKPANCAAQNGQSAQGENCRPDLTAVATTLGITDEELQSALGGPAKGDRRGGTDLTAAAATLGITVEKLQQALQDAKPADCSAPSATPDQSGQPAQDENCRPDLIAAATTLGITAEELKAALGGPERPQGGPDFTTAATTLGITVEELQQALQDAKPVECSATSQGGQPGQNLNCRPGLTSAATTLGITAEELQSALGNLHQGAGQPGNGQPPTGNP